jgi:gluconolactonase
MGRLNLRGSALIALTAMGFLLLAAPPGAAAPNSCSRGPITPRVLARTGDILEYGIFDSRGRFFYSDQTTGSLMRIDHFGKAAKKVASVPAPGAMVFTSTGSIIIGTGDSLSNGSHGDANPTSGLLRVNPITDAVKTYATGLGMANGIALAPDGSIYATNDLGYDVDRVKNGKVTHPWARVYSTNGVVVSPDDRYLFVSQTFGPAAIQRISIADPSHVTTYALAPNDKAAGLDDMTTDRRGNLYVAANLAGQIWKVNTKGTICVLASGLRNPSAVNFGVGTNSRNLYIVGFDGHISELANVLPTAPAPSPPPIKHDTTTRGLYRPRRRAVEARSTRQRLFRAAGSVGGCLAWRFI